jgi:hypothetical protein
MTDQDARPEVAAEAALQAAAESLKEQLAALDESIAYHEARAAELKETRRKVTRVEAIVSGPGPSKPGRKPGNGMTARHSAENNAKRNRVHEHVLAMGQGVDIRAHDLRPELNANGEQPIGDAFLKSILSELRDAGVLRLDRREAGGAAVYRLAVRGD